MFYKKNKEEQFESFVLASNRANNIKRPTHDAQMRNQAKFDCDYANSADDQLN